jgi:hypothetical protein
LSYWSGPFFYIRKKILWTTIETSWFMHVGLKDVLIFLIDSLKDQLYWNSWKTWLPYPNVLWTRQFLKVCEEEAANLVHRNLLRSLLRLDTAKYTTKGRLPSQNKIARIIQKLKEHVRKVRIVRWIILTCLSFYNPKRKLFIKHSVNVGSTKVST